MTEYDKRMKETTGMTDREWEIYFSIFIGIVVIGLLTSAAIIIYKLW